MEKYNFQADNESKVTMSMITGLLYGVMSILLFPTFGIIALVCLFTAEKVPMIVFIVLALFFGILGVVLIIRAVRTFVRGRYNISFSGQQIVVKQGKKEKQYLCSDIKEISADSLNKKNKGYIKCIFKDDNKIIFKKSDKDFQQVMEYFLSLIEIEGDEKYAVSLHSLTQLQSHASKE